MRKRQRARSRLENSGSREPPPGHWAAATFKKKFPKRQRGEPYVVVVHKPSDASYVLDGTYSLLNRVLTEAELEYIRSYHVEYWEGWEPTDDAQKPWWARNKPADEFEAFWIAE